MFMPVTIQAKKRFITWILDHCELKRRECTWVLGYLLEHDYLLANIHFVKDVINYPKGIMMTCRCSPEMDFRFHKHHIVTKDVEKSFHEIRLHPNERMYVQLNFKYASQHFYTSILEDQFFAQDHKKMRQADQERTERLLENVLQDVHKGRLRKQIDHALDERDEKKFIRLSNKWINAMKQ